MELGDLPEVPLGEHGVDPITVAVRAEVVAHLVADRERPPALDLEVAVVVDTPERVAVWNRIALPSVRPRFLAPAREKHLLLVRINERDETVAGQPFGDPDKHAERDPCCCS